jgi:hypothetical protein
MYDTSLYPTIVNGNSDNGFQTNTNPEAMTIAGGNNNRGSAMGATISGGSNHRAGGPSGLKGHYSTIAGGLSNKTGARDNSTGDYATVGGGYLNEAIGDASTVAGGLWSYAIGFASTVPGGHRNTATGNYSFAAGLFANAIHNGSFVWGDSNFGAVNSTAENQFVVRASGGVRLNPTTSLFFEPQPRQMINLGGDAIGIGAQTDTQYARTSAGAGQFCWFKGGVHSDAQCDAGAGGSTLMSLSDTELRVNGVLVSASDRNLKENFGGVNAKAVLAKVVGLPLSAWNYKADGSKSRHLGPMAQDFRQAFGLGSDDITIATTDVNGVALAAIQGLNQKLVAESRAKDAVIAGLKKKLEAIEKRLGL